MYCPEGHPEANRVGADPLSRSPAGDTRMPWDQQSEIEGVHQLAWKSGLGLLSRADDHDAVAIARDLLRCPSVTPADAGALGVLERVLKGAGFEVHRVTFRSPAQPIENLYARIGYQAPHLMFAGHTDVVPPGDARRWTHPPFAARSRTACCTAAARDMKGAIACKIAAVLDHLDCATAASRRARSRS